jgi:N6-L-threonylcarbamoyladenine synthase
MIAWAGAERLALGLRDTLDVAPRPRWPLDEVRGANIEIELPAADGAQSGATEPASAPGAAGPG